MEDGSFCPPPPFGSYLMSIKPRLVRVKAFKVKDGDKDKNKKMISFCIDDHKLLVKHRTI